MDPSRKAAEESLGIGMEQAAAGQTVRRDDFLDDDQPDPAPGLERMVEQWKERWERFDADQRRRWEEQHGDEAGDVAGAELEAFNAEAEARYRHMTGMDLPMEERGREDAGERGQDTAELPNLARGP